MASQDFIETSVLCSLIYFVNVLPHACVRPSVFNVHPGSVLLRPTRSDSVPTKGEKIICARLKTWTTLLGGGNIWLQMPDYQVPAVGQSTSKPTADPMEDLLAKTSTKQSLDCGLGSRTVPCNAFACGASDKATALGSTIRGIVWSNTNIFLHTKLYNTHYTIQYYTIL